MRYLCSILLGGVLLLVVSPALAAETPPLDKAMADKIFAGGGNTDTHAVAVISGLCIDGNGQPKFAGSQNMAAVIFVIGVKDPGAAVPPPPPGYKPEKPNAQPQSEVHYATFF